MRTILCAVLELSCYLPVSDDTRTCSVDWQPHGAVVSAIGALPQRVRGRGSDGCRQDPDRHRPARPKS
jgi:hypothetical protein